MAILSKKRAGGVLFLFWIAIAALSSAEEAAKFTREAQNLAQIPYGVILSELVSVGYSGDEHLQYDIFWTGGIKIGELKMDITSLAGVEDEYKVDVNIGTKGSVMDLIYPVRDRHVTLLKGKEKLPYQTEMWQEEGYSYEAHRQAVYDQKKMRVVTRKNGKTSGEYQLSGSTNNEFSAFLNSRLMRFVVDKPFLVPTFADKRRIPVKVTPLAKETLSTLLGRVETYVVMPQLTFKGLYDKQGDTVIWYTADECRVPVKVSSRIVIGSLTARLTAYENPACKRYNGAYKRKQGKTDKREECVK